MNVVIIGDEFSIFRSNAATNLVVALAVGLNRRRCKVTLISTANEFGIHSGVINRIEYYIPHEQLERSNNFIYRNYVKIRKYFNLIKFCYINNRNSRDILICYSESILFMFFAYILKILFFHSSYIYLVEHPYRYAKKQFNSKIIIFRIALSLFFNGQIFISYGLQKTFSMFRRSIVVPSMVISDRFLMPQNAKSPFTFEYIAYCGTITRHKDGVDRMIDGFLKLDEQYKELRIVIIGDFSSQQERDYFMDSYNIDSIRDKIIFTGPISRDMVPVYLSFSKLLILTRPYSLQSEMGFPTKLPEYLATGKPVIVSGVGDIPKYIEDEKDAYLLKHIKEEEVSATIEKVLNDYDHSLKVGCSGKRLTYGVFNCEYQAERIVLFFKSNSDAI